tara:strand:- start:1638 stop:1958 length:321 start_codon:yes stop_codon:yes gene_type:complete
MNLIKKSFIILLLVSLSSCGTLKEGFKNQKKNNNDEFLVEKKSPLIMPPDFDELPVPRSKEEKENSSKNSIKELITEKDDGLSKSTISDNSVKKFEELLIEKINKN